MKIDNLYLKSSGFFGYLDKIVRSKFDELSEIPETLDYSVIKKNIHKRNYYKSLKNAFSNLKNCDVGIIAEYKRSSPSRGIINDRVSIEDQLQKYKNGGAIALSILTEKSYFSGELSFLKSARNVSDLPLLRKDFIFSDYQIFESAASGADAVLLITAILTPDGLAEMIKLAKSLSMDTVVEVHTIDEAELAIESGADIIGINNRNLNSFEVNIINSVNIAKIIPEGIIKIAESGIRCQDDINLLKNAGINIFLIGETLMKSDNPEKVLKGLIYG